MQIKKINCDSHQICGITILMMVIIFIRRDCMLECFTKFMNQERFAKQLLLECGALTYCPKNHHLVKTTDERYVDFAVELANQIFIVCNKFQTAEELEKFIRNMAAKHKIGCEFCQDHPDKCSHPESVEEE